MKMNKALKRLAKIEALVWDATEGYSARAAHVQKVTQGAEAAVSRETDAGSLRASSGMPKKHLAVHSKPISRALVDSTELKRRISSGKRVIAATKGRRALKRANAAQGQQAGKKTVSVKRVVSKSRQ